MSSRPKLLAILDRSPFPADDGVRYPIAAHLTGLQDDWDLDLLLVTPTGAKKTGKEEIEASDLRYGALLQASAPPAGKFSRFLGESLSGIPYGHHPVIPDSEVASILGNRQYDAVYVAPILLALWAEAVARVLPKRPTVVLNLNDSISEKYRRFMDLAKMSHLPIRSRLNHGLKSSRALWAPRLESKMLGLFDLVLVQTPRDHSSIMADCGDSMRDKLLITPNGIKEYLLESPYRAAADKRLVHIGALVHNRRELLFWFISQVFPKVKTSLPDVTLHLAGSLSQQDRKYLDTVPGITAHGFVENLDSVLQDSTMSIAPMFMRTGLVNKNLDSLAAGVPCSGIKAFNGVEGFQSGVHGFEVESASQWSDLLIDVLQKPDLLNEVSSAGRKLVSNNCRWETTLARINDRMHELISAPRTAIGT